MTALSAGMRVADTQYGGQSGSWFPEVRQYTPAFVVGAGCCIRFVWLWWRL